MDCDLVMNGSPQEIQFCLYGIGFLRRFVGNGYVGAISVDFLRSASNTCLAVIAHPRNVS